MPDTLVRRLPTPHAGVWLSCSYFCYFASIGCFFPYISLYYRRLQLDGVQIGVLAAILPLGIAFIAPLGGTLADRFGSHRLLLRSTLLLAAITALLIAQVTSFIALVPLMLVLAVALASIPSLLDSYALLIADQRGIAYGRMRVWGSVGFIVSVWFVAWQMGQTITNFFLLTYAVALLLACVVSFGLPALPRHADSRQPMWHGISLIVRDRPVALLLFAVYLVTANATIMASYLSIYLVELGGTAQLAGTASALAAISELPVMVFGRWLLDRFGSRKILVLAVAVYLIRLLLFSLPPSLSWVLWVQLLHGLSFGLNLMASVTLVHELAGRDRAATAQGLLSSTSLGFGAITGSLVGGTLLDQIGAIGIFRVAATGMIVALAVCLIAVRVVARRTPVVQPVLQPSRE